MDELGITLQGIILHLIALLIVVVIVYFTVYKRIKQFMEMRKAEYQKAEDDIKQRTKNAEDMKQEYSTLVDQAKVRLSQINEEATNAAEIQAKVIIEEAKNNAKIMVEKASKDIEIEKSKMKTEFKNEVADLAIDIAGKILMREINNSDTENVINDSLNVWVNESRE